MSQLVTFQLTETDQQLLLQIARNAVRAYLSAQSPRLPDRRLALTESRGVFVSIHRSTDLRGCIGNVHPAGPLYRSAAECAIAAAVGDPRFMPLMPQDLPDVEFEISVLSPMNRVKTSGNRDRNPWTSNQQNARGLLCLRSPPHRAGIANDFFRRLAESGSQTRRLEGRRDHPMFQRVRLRRKAVSTHRYYMTLALLTIPIPI